MEQLPVRPGPYFIHNSWFEINEDCPGNMLSGTCLAEEGVEAIVASADGLVGGHLPVRLDSVLQAVQFPAGIADLHTSLAHMYGDALTLEGFVNWLSDL